MNRCRRRCNKRFSGSPTPTRVADPVSRLRIALCRGRLRAHEIHHGGKAPFGYGSPEAHDLPRELETGSAHCVGDEVVHQAGIPQQFLGAGKSRLDLFVKEGDLLPSGAKRAQGGDTHDGIPQRADVKDQDGSLVHVGPAKASLPCAQLQFQTCLAPISACLEGV